MVILILKNKPFILINPTILYSSDFVVLFWKSKKLGKEYPTLFPPLIKNIRLMSRIFSGLTLPGNMKTPTYSSLQTCSWSNYMFVDLLLGMDYLKELASFKKGQYVWYEKSVHENLQDLIVGDVFYNQTNMKTFCFVIINIIHAICLKSPEIQASLRKIAKSWPPTYDSLFRDNHFHLIADYFYVYSHVSGQCACYFSIFLF